jgi:hypothetical protein
MKYHASTHQNPDTVPPWHLQALSTTSRFKSRDADLTIWYHTVHPPTGNVDSKEPCTGWEVASTRWEVGCHLEAWPRSVGKKRETPSVSPPQSFRACVACGGR